MHRLFALVLGLSIVVAACTPSDGSSTTTSGSNGSATSTEAPVTTTTEPPDGYGGNLAVATDDALVTLNPFAPSALGDRLAGQAVWATVYDVDPESWQRVPDTVAALPSQADAIEVNEDGTMTVRYEIAPGARWSDGSPITGQDLAFTAETMRDLALARIGGVDPVMATVVETDAVEQLAFITFSEPTLAFEDALWIILPSVALGDASLDRIVNQSDGTDWPSGGPFVVDALEPGVEIRFVRNELYWKKDAAGGALPYLDSLTVTHTPETADTEGLAGSVGSVVDGSVDIATGFFSDADIAALDEAGAVVATVPTPNIEQLTFSFSETHLELNPQSANAALDFRQFVASSIDRTQILDETAVPWPAGTPGMLIPLGTSAWSSYEGLNSGDPELSEDAASVLSTTANTPYRVRVVDELVPLVDASGSSTSVDNVDSILFFGEGFALGAFDIGMWAWSSDGGYGSKLRLMQLLDPATEPPAGNYAQWGVGDTSSDATERFSELVVEAQQTFDPVRFDEIVAEAEVILAEDLPVIPLFSRGSHAAMLKDVALNVVHNGSQSTIAWNVEVWQRVGE
jgi:ABC-type transport system substrate-binding protein